MSHAKAKNMKQNTLKIKYKEGHYLKKLYISVYDRAKMQHFQQY